MRETLSISACRDGCYTFQFDKDRIVAGLRDHTTRVFHPDTGAQLAVFEVRCVGVAAILGPMGFVHTGAHRLSVVAAV